MLDCHKWGCNKWGLKGCLFALPGNRPKSAFFALFLPFPHFSGGCEEHLGNPENRGKKAVFFFSPSDLLKPPSLKPPLQGTPSMGVATFFRSFEELLLEMLFPEQSRLQ